jgi:hypothetical protein
MTDINHKGLKLKIQYKKTHLIIGFSTILMIVISFKTLSRDSNIGAGVFLGVFVLFLWLTDYLLTSQFSVILDEKGISINLVRKGFGVTSPKTFYQWSDIKNFRVYSVKGERHLILSLVNGDDFNFLGRQTEDLNTFLTEHFPEKQYKMPLKWDDM